MNIAKAMVGGFVAGAAAMYFADPSRGRRRRVIARDKMQAGWRDVLREVDKAGRDLRNRSQAVVSAVRTLRSRAEADEPVIVERVRAVIGRAVSHPHALSVTAEPGGRVVLAGPVLQHEVECLLNKVWAVQGVKEVVNRLEVHAEAGTLASLQGGRPRGGRRESMPQSWTPIQRVAAGTLAGTTLISSMRQEGVTRLAGVLAAGGLLARAVTNQDLRQVFGISGSDAVRFDKTIHILAPVDEVFAFWSKFENFPRFMAHLKEVRDLGNGRSKWTALGPGGIAVPWEAEITEWTKNELLCWKSLPGSLINSVGRVRFSPTAESGTQVHIQMSYCPPAGVLGHGVAWLFGTDPKTEMDDDLVRLKSLLEVGKTRAHGSTFWREELQTATP